MLRNKARNLVVNAKLKKPTNKNTHKIVFFFIIAHLSLSGPNSSDDLFTRRGYKI